MPSGVDWLISCMIVEARNTCLLTQFLSSELSILKRCNQMLQLRGIEVCWSDRSDKGRAWSAV